jgi:ABC-2 type transport system permease protein
MRAEGTTGAPRTPGPANGTAAQRVAALVRKELRQIFRDRKTKRIVFASPIIQLLLFGYAVTTDVHDVATYVVDHDRTAASRALQDALTSTGHFRIVGTSDRPAALAAALDRGSAAIGVEIPAGFARDVAAGRPARVQVLVDGSSSNTATIAQGHASRIVQEYGIAEAAARGRTLDGGIDLRARAWFNPGLESRVYNVPAVVGVLLLLMCLLLTALSVVRERELGTLEQLMVSPLAPGELILGKTIPVAIIGFIDLILICVVAVLWFKVPLTGSLLALGVAAGVYIIGSLGLGLYISTVSRTQQEAFMVMFLVMLPSIILSGFLYPIHTMPEFFQVVSWFNPLRHFLIIVRGIFLKGHGLADIWQPLVIIAIMGAAVLAAATARFRRYSA